VDALRALGADPVKKLVVPRVFATMLVLPLMTAFAVVTGVLGGALIASMEGDMKMSYFYNASLRATTMADFLSGLFKTLFFGFNIAIVACRNGLHTRGGTVGVGQATTSTVVVTSVTTLISDFFLTKLAMVLGWIQ
jgi:phospholipid/cholesterol/gamma-HCH transport system permease protein